MRNPFHRLIQKAKIRKKLGVNQARRARVAVSDHIRGKGLVTYPKRMIEDGIASPSAVNQWARSITPELAADRTKFNDNRGFAPMTPRVFLRGPFGPRGISLL